jgi:hypothetical protein
MEVLNKKENTKKDVFTYKTSDAKSYRQMWEGIRNWDSLRTAAATVVNYWLEKNLNKINKLSGNQYRQGKRYKVQILPKSAKVNILVSQRLGLKWLECEKTMFRRDYNFKVKVNCKAILIDEEGNEKPDSNFTYNLGYSDIMRMHNCCGMAVVTNICSYLPERSGVACGTLITHICDIVLFANRYRASTITNRESHSNIGALEKMGYKKNLTWKNARTNYDLFQASKAFEDTVRQDYNTFAFLTGGPSEMREDLETIDPAVKGLIEKKSEVKKEKKSLLMRTPQEATSAMEEAGIVIPVISSSEEPSVSRGLGLMEQINQAEQRPYKGLTHAQMQSVLDQEREKNRRYWNQLMSRLYSNQLGGSLTFGRRRNRRK